MSKLVAICHGILSNADNMLELQNGISGPGVTAYRHPYEWRKTSVLVSGMGLAEAVRGLVDEAKGDLEEVVLIGHSQGGLVSRVAAAALENPDGLKAGIEALTHSGGLEGYKGEALRAWEHFERSGTGHRPVRLRGVATLATPNSGALTFGQLSIAGRLISGGLSWIGEKTGQAKDLSELTTDRLFRVLQYVHIANVRYLSISGSASNRFSKASWTEVVGELPLLGRLGINLELPNDLIVEDESVDMRESVLPTEIADLSSQYEHVRLFRNCTDVDHAKIHRAPEVWAQLRAWMARVFSIAAATPGGAAIPSADS